MSADNTQLRDPEVNRARFRQRILSGSSFLLDQLNDIELAEMQQMLLSGEAEIINSACKPFVIAKLDRVILPP